MHADCVLRAVGNDLQSQAPFPAAPIFDQYVRLGARTKPFEAQALVAEPAVEARDDASPCPKNGRARRAMGSDVSCVE